MRPAPLLGLLGLLVLPLTACATRTHLVESSPAGEVWAVDEDAGRVDAERAWLMTAALAALDAPLEVRPVTIYVLPDIGNPHAYGGYYARSHTIVLDADRADADASMAHELVHAFEPAAWRTLPAVVREGLADRLALAVVPAVADELRHRRLQSLADRLRADPTDLPSAHDALRLSVADLAREDDAALLRALYGLGLFLADRAGVDALHALAEEAAAAGAERVAPERVLDAAGVSGASDDLTAWLADVDRHADAARGAHDVRD